jgi:hypothetical protein
MPWPEYSGPAVTRARDIYCYQFIERHGDDVDTPNPPVRRVAAHRVHRALRHRPRRHSAGATVFTWSLFSNYATSFEYLRTLDGWLRMLLFAVLCIGEWVIAAGWIVGSLLWLWRDTPGNDKRKRRR